MRVRLRGIYATALTARLAAEGFDVVQASPPIRRRFDADFDVAEHDVRVETDASRQGVECTGDAEGVAAVVARLRETGVDAFAWHDAAPRYAVFDATVERTSGGGAVLDLDGREGYLPYGNAEGHVAEGDVLRVQVRDPAAPWADHRPVLDATLRTPGGVAALVRGVDSAVADTPDGSAEHELVRLTEMLSPTVPDDWGVEWGYAAEDAGMGGLEAALEDAVGRAEAFEEALADAPPDAGEPGTVAAPVRTEWVWFGRESRFALDAVRRDATPTMTGHHRIKAASSRASDAVDFVERLCPSVDRFPFEAVVEQFGPAEGDRVAIQHGKPDGRLLTLGRAAVVDVDPETETVTVRREMTGGGSYDALGVPKESGDVAVTKLREGRWWYPTTYRAADGDVKGTYVNVCTPVELFPDAARYVDLHVDVVRHADGSVETVDADELGAAVDAGHVSEALAERARDVAARVERGIS